MNSKIDFINSETNKSLIKMFAPLMVGMIMLMIYNMVANLVGAEDRKHISGAVATIIAISTIFSVV